MDSAEKSIGMSYICVWPAPPAHVLVVGQRPLPRPSLYLLSALEELGDLVTRLAVYLISVLNPQLAGIEFV